MLKVTHLFSGIGALEEALKNLKIDFEVVNYCDLKPSPQSKSYSIIHDVSEDRNLGDIVKVNEKKLDDFDLMFYGFPCQDISILGKQEGIVKGETRSGLLYEALRIAKEKKPKYLIAENVKMLVGDKFKGDFNKLLIELREIGYENYWALLNTLNYGLPQNRERIFIVSIRKDIDNGYVFPKPIVLETRLRDILELGQELDYTYYLTEQNIKSYITKEGDFCERLNIKNPYKENASCLIAKGCKSVITNNFILDIHGVRGLTEREYFKLQGFNPNYAKTLKENGISSNQIYRMIGNSISVPVLEGILKNLLIKKEHTKQLMMI